MRWWFADRVYPWLADYGLELATLVAFALPQLERVVALALLTVYSMSIPYLLSAIGKAWWIIEINGDLRRRISHGVEHATIEILVGEGAPAQQAHAEWDHFFVRIEREGEIEHWRARVRDAAERAIARISNGETRLLYTPECSTNACVTRLVLAAGLVTCGVVAYWCGTSPALQLAALTVVVRAGAALGHVLGLRAQRRYTVASQFRSVQVVDVVAGEGDQGFDFRVVLDIVPRRLARVPSAT